jgi:hypothetical protein
MGEVTAPERPPEPNRHASPGTGVRVLPPLYADGLSGLDFAPSR